MEKNPLWNEWEKNIRDKYVERGIEHDLKEFVEKGKVNILFIIGPSGKGKTSLFFFLIEDYLNSEEPAFFFESPESIDEIKEEICGLFGIKEKKEKFIEIIRKRFGINNKLIIFVDRFEYVGNKEEIICQCKNNFISYIASREESAKTIKQISEKNIYKIVYLSDFSEQQVERAIAHYKIKIESIPPTFREFLKDPFMLKILSETYSGSQEFKEKLRSENRIAILFDWFFKTRFDMEKIHPSDGWSILRKVSARMFFEGRTDLSVDKYLTPSQGFSDRDKEIIKKLIRVNIFLEDIEKGTIRFYHDKLYEYALARYLYSNFEEEIESKLQDVKEIELLYDRIRRDHNLYEAFYFLFLFDVKDKLSKIYDNIICKEKNISKMRFLFDFLRYLGHHDMAMALLVEKWMEIKNIGNELLKRKNGTNLLIELLGWFYDPENLNWCYENDQQFLLESERWIKNLFKYRHVGIKHKKVLSKVLRGIRLFEGRINKEDIELGIKVTPNLSKLKFIELPSNKVLLELDKPLLLWNEKRIEREGKKIAKHIKNVFGRKPCVILYDNIKIIWPGNIWPPSIDSFFMAQILKKYYFSKNIETVLDMGCGTGFLGIYLAKNNSNIKKVVAVDIFNLCLKITKINVEENDLDVEFDYIKSDGFKNLRGLKFDLIVSLPPFLPTICKHKGLIPEYEYPVLGTNLLEDLLLNGKDFAPEIVLEFSNISKDVFDASIHNIKNCLREKPTLLKEFEVPFRVPYVERYKDAMEYLAKRPEKEYRLIIASPSRYKKYGYKWWHRCFIYSLKFKTEND